MATDWQPAMEKLWSDPTILKRLWLNRGDMGFGQEAIMAWQEAEGQKRPQYLIKLNLTNNVRRAIARGPWPLWEGSPTVGCRSSPRRRCACKVGARNGGSSSCAPSNPPIPAPSAVAPVAEPTAAPAAKPDNRLPIDSEARKQNRTLPTPKVLNLLHTQLPAAYRLAEVVGKWVWVTFKEQPAAEIRQQLAQLGFHWNRDRQAWQHPCGQFSLSSNDPHEKYSSYRPASIRRSTKTQATEAAA